MSSNKSMLGRCQSSEVHLGLTRFGDLSSHYNVARDGIPKVALDRSRRRQPPTMMMDVGAAKEDGGGGGGSEDDGKTMDIPIDVEVHLPKLEEDPMENETLASPPDVDKAVAAAPKRTSIVGAAPLLSSRGHEETGPLNSGRSTKNVHGHHKHKHKGHAQTPQGADGAAAAVVHPTVGAVEAAQVLPPADKTPSPSTTPHAPAIPKVLPPLGGAGVASLLDAYKEFHKNKREDIKTKKRMTLIASRPPPVITTVSPAQDPSIRTANERMLNKSGRMKTPATPAATSMMLDGKIFTKEEVEAIIKTQAAIRRHLAKKNVMSMAKPAEYLRVVCERLFSECCKAEALPDGMVTYPDGQCVLGGPNIPRILRILEDPTHGNLDLLQRHGVDRLTAAHAACQRGYLDLLTLLVTFWSTQSPDAREDDDEEGESHTALLYKLLHVVNNAKASGKLLRECGYELTDTIKALGFTPDYVFNALEQFHFKEVTLQDIFKICGHPLVRARDLHGNTPLHYAAEGGYVAVCEFLLEHGANINEQNIRGETPLHFAISSMHEPVGMLLVKRKADVTLARYRMIELDTGQHLRGVIVTAPASDEQCQMLADGPNAKHSRQEVKPKTPPTAAAGATKRRVLPSISIARKSKPTVRFIKTTVGVFMRQFDHDDPRLGDMVFFREANDESTSNRPLVIFYIGVHISMPRFKIALERQSHTKILHLLILHMPHVAYLAIDQFRTPLFRCRVVPGVRDVGQSWHIEGWLSTDDRRKKLVARMKQKGHAVRKIPKRWRWLYRTWEYIKIQWERFVSPLFAQGEVVVNNHTRKYRKTESVRLDSMFKAAVKANGIVYEYRYESESSSGASPTLQLIIKSECKELMAHPWVQNLRDHKWETFARKHFMRQLRQYTFFFVSYFISIVLLVGDTSIGLQEGGYRAPLFGHTAVALDYVRTIASLICLVYTAMYTSRHIQEINKGGWLLFIPYMTNIWTIFDIVLLGGIWFTSILDIFVFMRTTSVDWDAWRSSNVMLEDHYRVITYQESTFNVVMYREYDWHTTIMCITAPQVSVLIFIRWLQFCRGSQTLGPFVRMIYQMMGDIGVFLFVFVLFLFGFAFAFYTLQLDGFRTLVSATNSVYQMSLGQWDWGAIAGGGPLGVCLYILYTCFGTIMMLNLLVAMLGRTYEEIWDDRLLFFHLERAQTILKVQHEIKPDKYRRKYWCQTLYTLEGDAPIQGIPNQHFDA
ncbi:Aste57867_309 [Aphanomyces stellatus]|uniref:Aste57867_309 protein n=1 Tax=Aphanomyces stellatus TaxID=120398 RepID=A0A485K3F8_9STRA|nr:hypothetical protein As57867_000309 [Aphanomyces stellatus]VFT77535.1 Aste57867_309 [Aphanomyces stellatus]